MTSEVQATEEKIDEVGFIKIKSVRESKDIINKMKRQSSEWGENICKLYVWELLSRLYRELLNNNQKIT